MDNNLPSLLSNTEAHAIKFSQLLTNPQQRWVEVYHCDGSFVDWLAIAKNKIYCTFNVTLIEVMTLLLFCKIKIPEVGISFPIRNLKKKFSIFQMKN